MSGDSFVIRDTGGVRIAAGSREACEAAARLLEAPMPAVVRQCRVGDVVRAMFTRGLIDAGRKYRLYRLSDDGLRGAPIAGVGMCSLEGFEYVPPAPDPGFPADYASDLVPPGWERIDFENAKHGVGYMRTLGQRKGRAIYEQTSCGWTWMGSPHTGAEDGAPMHEAMRLALGLDWIGELWADPEAMDRP